jgi:2-amino-4-hydroxy-6-hydroxymethyldihydropteridine diphosphokinase
MFPILEIGPLAIKADGFFLLISLAAGLWLTGKFAISLRTNGEAIENGLLTALVAGLVGARVGFILQNPATFLENPLSVLSLSPSMLTPTFGWLVALLAMIIYAQKKHLPARPTLDTLTPLVILMTAGWHLASLAQGSAYGLPADLPWSIELWNTARHPTQIYGLVLSLLVLAGFLYHTRGLKTTGFFKSGVLFFLSIASLTFTILIVRGFMAERPAGVDPIQFGLLALMTGSLFLAFRRLYSDTKTQHRVLISIGSNLKPLENLEAVEVYLSEEETVVRRSSYYETKDVKHEDNPARFINAVIEIKTEKSFPDLYRSMKSLEETLGREPEEKQTVPIDLDILTYDDEVFEASRKMIPDPNLDQYPYIAVPLSEIAPDFNHPATGQHIQDILNNIKDSSDQITKVKLQEVEK